jgi:tetratricopeptide (TPR) repeat protein
MNPFPGLRPFTQEEDYLFFGREEQTLELLARLGSQRFVAVVGTSGSGKSSLVRCGLLSELLGGKMRDAGAAWEIAVTHPGGNPLGLLTEALLDADLYDRAAENTRENLLATLSRSHFGLVEAVKQAGLGEGTNFLLVVDQFEEIFRFHEAGQTQQEMANEFVSLLLEAAAQKEVPIYVVLTMRSDFIGECGQFEGLAEAVNRGEFLIPRLTREQYKRVIEGPIRVAGGTITPRLLQRLLNDLGQQADQLPCLQHALMRTWNVWAERGQEAALDLEDYQRVGKMTHALSLHADEIYDALATDRERQLCRGLFQALTVQESENRGIRRPQRLGRLCQILDVSAEELLPIIDAYRRHGVTFLMPAPEVELTDRTIIDISHESLMRVWTRLRNWVEEEAQAAGIYLRLSESAALYGQGKAGLYRDPELGIALAWRESQRPNAAWAERYRPGFDTAMAFLAASQEASVAEEQAREAARQRELEQARQLAEAQRLRLEQQRRSARKLRKMIAGLAVVAVIAGVACALALVANQRANALADKARHNEVRALRNEEQARENALLAERSEQKTAKALATVAAQKAEVEDSLSSSLEYFSAALKQADGYEARKPIFALLARFDMVLSAFVERQPEDQQLQLALARRLAERGQMSLANKQPAKAQDELEKSRAIFTRLLSPNNRWKVLTPIEMKTDTGAKMELQKDGSVFVHQVSPGRNDAYTLAFQTALKGITGLRLEVLADSRLPHGGPGWMSMNGTFLLSELTLEAASADSRDKARAIPLRNAWADFSQPGGDVRGAVDGNDRTVWAIWPEVNKDHTAVFELAEKVGDGAAARLTVRLIHGLGQGGNLGRFRLSFTNDAKTLQAPQIRQDLNDGELVDCNIALGKALAQQGQTKEAIASFTEALLLAADRAGKAKIIAEAAPLKGVLEQLTERAAGEGQFQAELAQHFAAQGRAPLAKAARAKARAWFEAKLAKAPENSALAAELTQVLLDRQEQEHPRWTILRPMEMKSQGGATLTLQPDGSILASGTNPDRDVYSLVARAGLKQLTAVRLEALPDPSLPRNGPGRFPGTGNFHLNRLRVFSGGALVPLSKIAVAHSENPDFQNLINDTINAMVGWSNHPRAGMANSAVVATRLERAADGDLKVELYCSRAQFARQHNLGRFRVSVSGEPAAFEREAAAMKVTDPWLKLAAAYAVNGFHEEALHYCSRALKRADGYEARKPILEVAARFDQVLAALSKRQPDDPQLQLALARKLAERGTQRLAEKRPAKAQAELEKSRAIYVRLLAQYPRPHWTVLKPAEMNSKGGATLSMSEDGSILASGTNPPRDEYTLLARPSLEHITAIRLEALPDPSLPNNGPGRSPAGPNGGNFHLNKLRVFSGGQPCPLTNIIVDHPNMVGNTPTPYQQVIRGEVDNSPGWGNWPRAGKANAATIATRVARAAKDDLKIEMIFSRSGWIQHNLGRFRLAVTNTPDALRATEFRKDLSDSEVADLNVALAKAHAQQGRTTEAVALFTEALRLTADRAGKARIIAEAAPLEGVLAKLAERTADDGRFQAELARQLVAQGRAPSAKVARGKARAWFEEELAKEPKNSALAAELADLLLLDTTPWTVLKPAEMKSNSGVALTLKEDQSILVRGKYTARDVYSVDYREVPREFHAIRLEALRDDSLPGGGPGTYASGLFVLSAFKAFRLDEKQAAPLKPIPLRSACATFEERPAQESLDAVPGGGWSISGGQYQAQSAYFSVGRDPKISVANGLRILLDFSHIPADGKPATLGRFRLSVSTDAGAFDREKARLAAMTLTDPWPKLAAAYHVLGDRQAIDELVKGHTSAATGVGDLYAAAQDWERAIAEYRRFVTDQPADGALLTRLAAAYQSAGRTREGIPYLAKASAADPKDTLLSLQVASFQAWFGQGKELAATGRRILASAKGTNDVVMAERAAKACCILPATEKAERDAARALGRTAVEVGNGGEWNLLALGMAEYRSQNYAAADKALRAAAEAGKNNPAVTGIAPFYQALSLFRQGKPDEARKLAILAAAKMKPLPADEKNPLAGDADHDDLILWLAYKEARALLQFDAAPAANWLTRALAHHRLGETDQARKACRKAAEMLRLAPVTTAGAIAPPVAPVAGVPAAKGQAIFRAFLNFNAKDPVNCPGKPGCAYKLLPVKLMAGRTYILEMDHVDQSGLDPFLVLANRAGQVVAQDDDSGGNLNARIVYRAPETGMFRVYATTFLPGMTGAFRLTVSAQAGATSPDNTDLRALLRQTVLALGTESPEAWELIAAAAGEPPATLNEAIRQNPGQAKSYRDRGSWHAQRGRWKDAIADYAEVFRLDPNTLDAMRLGVLLARSGEKQSYREHCQAMLGRWASTENNSEADQTLKTIVLIPDSRGDAKQRARLAEAAVAGDPARDWYEWWLVAKALHDLRAGRYADALAACRASRQRAPQSKGEPQILTALDLAIEAMALQGAGKADEARRTLEQAKPLIDSHIPGIDGGDWWADWLAAHLLYREAVGRILTKNAEPKN